MDDVAGILEGLPFRVREDVAPGTTPAHERLEAAEFLHAVELCVGEAELGVLAREPGRDGGEVGGAEAEELGEAVVVAVRGVGAVAEAGVAGGEGVGAEVWGLWDGLEGCGRGPVEAEEAGAEVAGCVDDAVGVAGPEAGFLAGWRGGEEVGVAGAQLDAGREGFERAGEGTGGGELLEVFVWVWVRFSG